jgi:SAM-dependent methyltransferase
MAPLTHRLESWWWTRAEEEAGSTDPATVARRFAPPIDTLSRQFTDERPGDFGDYTGTRADAVAYGLYFFPQTFARMTRILRELHDNRGWSVPPSLRVLDIGSGTGGSLLGAASFLNKAANGSPIDAVAVDRSGPALDLLSGLVRDHQELWPRLSCRTMRGDITQMSLPGPWDLILAGFLLNELFENQPAEAALPWVQKQLATLNSGGLLVLCEPAQSLTSRRLQDLRRLVLAGQHAHVWGPCLHANTCPLLDTPHLWCHEVRSWSPPPGLLRINRILQRTIYELKFSFLVLSPTPPTPLAADPRSCRLVSPVLPLKGRMTATGCAADGQLHTYEIQTRRLDKKKTAAWARDRRGALCVWPEIRQLGDPPVWRSDSLPDNLAQRPDVGV